jgi:dUTPase
MTKITVKKHYSNSVEIPDFKFAIREDLKDTRDLFLPSRGTPKSTGWDVRAAWEDKESRVISFGEHIKIPLGFRTFAPDGWWYELKPRSSTFVKKKLHSLYGTIDEDYEGQLIFACQYLPEFRIEYFQQLGGAGELSYIFTKDEVENTSLTIDFGEAIGQIIPVKRQEMSVESISNEEFDTLCKKRAGHRGDGGFGSTSK